MPFRFDARQHFALGRDLLRDILLVAPLAVMVGAACAFFLMSLDWATQTRFAHPFLLWLLPFAGVAIAALYKQWGQSSEAGNNLLLDAIHDADIENTNQNDSTPDSSPIVPRRMAPLILLTTVITHLFGGSAGREGTAIQMGGAIASAWYRVFRLDKQDSRILLLCGVAAGFGGIFGTPLAGCVFALEVLSLGRVKYDALVPCLFAALISDGTVRALSIPFGIHHTAYHVADFGGLDLWLCLKIGLASFGFGLCATLFAELTHGIGHLFKNLIPNALLRPFCGGLILITLTLVLRTHDYLGLGVAPEHPGAVTLVSAFQSGGAGGFSWLLKLLFTAITLGSGFKGGEVTPLFFIGATLGNALSGPLHAPADLLAGAGLVGVFAGATNTPLACTLLGIELFGAQNAPYFAISCFLSYLWSGHGGIYLSQRIGWSKHAVFGSSATLREARTRRPSPERP